ncbi:hypothetical protein COLO4_03347 [Corchorus olitorius]|uniref:Uncharacterized protein n=1 Tax=Corchorus olitorius TaxID=93759 RepID=A0A1R3KZ03_9ROSI|nr:hypothetical protein COLO4_03347 [Corchorus olitorius]
MSRTMKNTKNIQTQTQKPSTTGTAVHRAHHL